MLSSKSYARSMAILVTIDPSKNLDFCPAAPVKVSIEDSDYCASDNNSDNIPMSQYQYRNIVELLVEQEVDLCTGQNPGNTYYTRVL
ncbi:MAG: hypothetical protein ACO4AI_07825, partial [Prochlorothrix sp.]